MKVEISIDDAGINDLKVADLIYKHGLATNTVFYWPVMPVVANSPKGRMSLSDDQMGKLAEAFEIGSHTITHQLLTRIPVADARREIVESRSLLQQKFNQPINKFCWPRGYTTPELELIAQEAGYESARGVAVGRLDPFDRFNTSTTVHAGYDRKEYAGLDWYTYAMRMLSTAKSEKGAVYHVWLHSHELDAYPDGYELFESLLRALAEEVER